MPVQFTSSEQTRPITINPGDLVVADGEWNRRTGSALLRRFANICSRLKADGVVVVPPSNLAKCVEVCEDRLRVDQKTIEALLRGEAMGPTIARLRK